MVDGVTPDAFIVDEARYSLYGSEKQAEEELGHKMSPFRDGVSYCYHRDCGATVKIQGSLPALDATGTALMEPCPYRG